MNFYSLQLGPYRNFIEGASANDWESVTCDKDPGHQRAGRRITELFLDVQSRKVVDFARTMLSDIVITDHALDVLRGAHLTGFEVRPARVKGLPKGVRMSNLPSLWEFVVTGQGGFAHKDSGIVKLFTCDGCGLVRYSAYEHGLLVDDSTYDGSDFFTVTEYPQYVLVTPRAKAVIEQAQLTNVGFVDSSQLEWPQGVLKPRLNVE